VDFYCSYFYLEELITIYTLKALPHRPVDRRAMDESIQVLQQAVQAAKIDDKEKTRSLQRLRRFVPENANS
jgi:hypothetical protein